MARTRVEPQTAFRLEESRDGGRPGISLPEELRRLAGRAVDGVVNLALTTGHVVSQRKSSTTNRAHARVAVPSVIFVLG